jgi:hypothetical protein
VSEVLMIACLFTPNSTSLLRLIPGFSGGTFPAQLGAPSNLTGFLIMSALSQFLLQAAPLQEFLEAAQGGANWLALMNTHP